MGGRSGRVSLEALALAALVALGAGCGGGSSAPLDDGGGDDTGGGGGDDTGGGGDTGGGDDTGGGGGVVDPGGGDGSPVPGDRITFGTQGPWPVENRVYGNAAGIREGWITGVTTDEAQNRWIATSRALYLATPGGGVWRFDENDGLHLGEATGLAPGPVGWVKYCDMAPIADDAPCTGELRWGGATAYGIKSVAGGGPNEVFVGYHGGHTPGTVCDGGPDWCDPLRHSGKIDRVRLRADGSIQVDRFDFWINQHGLGYWHNRTPFRLLYDHVVHPGTLYAAADHGIVIVFPDRYVPFSGVDLDAWLDTFIGDHLHAQVCYHQSCASGGHPRAGDWRGLAFDGDGRLWHAGQYSAGLVTWDPDPVNWWQRYGGAFVASFGDPYPVAPNDVGYQNEPVFKVPLEGDDVDLTAVSVCPDGRVWFASSGPTQVNETVAVWNGRSFRTYDALALGLGTRAVEDLVCLPDGRLVLGGTAGAVVWDPASGASKRLGGLPGTRVVRFELDTMVSPFALHVATDSGAAVLRAIP